MVSLSGDSVKAEVPIDTHVYMVIWKSASKTVHCKNPQRIVWNPNLWVQCDVTLQCF